MIHESFVTDKKGRRIAVQIPIKAYEKLIADLEELNDMKAYNCAKARKSEPIPFEQAFTHIASEKALAKDWLSPEEDEAWKDL